MSVHIMTGPSQGSVSAKRAIKLRTKGFLVSRKVKLSKLLDGIVMFSFYFKAVFKAQHVTCETDEDCDRNEVCMSWQYDPTLEYAR